MNNDEYTVLTPSGKVTGEIYVTVNDGTAATTPDLANATLQNLNVTGKAALYSLPAGDFTEADVVDAILIQDDDASGGTIKGRSGLVLTTETLELTNDITYGVDANTITLSATGTEKKAAKFIPTANTNYAFVYTKTAPASTKEEFQPITKVKGTSVNGLYRYALTSAPTPVDGSPTGDVQVGVKYFSDINASADMLTVFAGQDVSNLYLDNVGTIASGLAKTGTTYYYTTDHGVTYTAAYALAYEGFATAVTSGLLYEESTTTPGTFVATTDAKPMDGKAYYYGPSHDYCVIYPQRTGGLFVIDETAAKVKCEATDVAVDGMTYFDKYTKSTGAALYAKIIKVQ